MHKKIWSQISTIQLSGLGVSGPILPCSPCIQICPHPHPPPQKRKIITVLLYRYFFVFLMFHNFPPDICSQTIFVSSVLTYFLWVLQSKITPQHICEHGVIWITTITHKFIQCINATKTCPSLPHCITHSAQKHSRNTIRVFNQMEHLHWNTFFFFFHKAKSIVARQHSTQDNIPLNLH